MYNKTSRFTFTKQVLLLLPMVGVLCLSACTSDPENPAKYKKPYYENFLPIYNYRGNTQNVHPKVLFFPDSLWGHPYWMAYSPYPNGNPKYENPCVAFSDDGISWQNIRKNPLDIPSNTYLRYNSDPHLLYNPNTQKLEVWFRYANEEFREERIYRMTSDDGQNWMPKELLLHNAGNGNCALYLSPTIYYDDGKYHIWTVCASPYSIKYYETPDGRDWQYVRSIKLTYQYNGKNFHPWHIDVIHCDGLYRMTVMVKENAPGNTWCLFYSESEDNEHWSTPTIMLLPRTNHWDEQLYRSSLVKTEQGYKLYYSARRENKYGIGLCQAPSPLQFMTEQP